jgi:hypothetical protein
MGILQILYLFIMTNTIQITKTPAISSALDFIKTKYFLLSEEEIIKMAISNQYNLINDALIGDEMDATDLENSSTENRSRLIAAMNQDPATARHFKDVDALKKALNFVD